MSDTKHALPQPDFFTPADVAALLRCSAKTIRRRIIKGLIPARMENGRILIDPRDYMTYVRKLTSHAEQLERRRRERQAAKNHPKRPRKRASKTRT
jgi:hypothetical protein